MTQPRSRRRIVPPRAAEVEAFRAAIEPMSEAERTLILGIGMVIKQHGLPHLVAWIQAAADALHRSGSGVISSGVPEKVRSRRASRGSRRPA